MASAPARDRHMHTCTAGSLLPTCLHSPHLHCLQCPGPGAASLHEAVSKQGVEGSAQCPESFHLLLDFVVRFRNICSLQFLPPSQKGKAAYFHFYL